MSLFKKKKQKPQSFGTLNPEHSYLEPASSTWVFIKAWAEKRLKTATDECISRSNDELDTEFYRGQVRILQDLIALPETSEKKSGLLEMLSNDEI
jgi:hypothetical protein